MIYIQSAVLIQNINDKNDLDNLCSMKLFILTIFSSNNNHFKKMNSNSSESHITIDLLRNICNNLNYYIPLIYLPIGIIGNLLNILTFTRPSLLTNQCTTFLLYSSIANIFHLTFGLVTRIIIDHYHFDIEGSSLVFCKLKYYIMYNSASLSLYFVLFASINRYYQSKSNSRQWCLSQLMSPHRICLTLTLINCLIYIHILILFRIEHTKISSKNVQSICYAIHGPYRIFLDFFLVITWSLLPPCLMLYFGIFTIRNLRVTNIRVSVLGDINIRQRRRSRKKTDVQLVFMLLLQIIIIFCSTLPFGLQKIVSTLKPAKTVQQLSVEHFILCITRQISYTNSAFCFFFYILTAKKFRMELINSIQKIFT